MLFPQRIAQLLGLAALTVIAGVTAACIRTSSGAIVRWIPIVGEVARNNELVRDWERTLYQYPLPPQAQVISRSSAFGLLEGNGNHCDVRVVQNLLTTQSAAEIETYYKASGIVERLEPSRRGLALLIVTNEGEPQLDGRRRIRVELFGHGGNMMDQGGFDLRCH